jgi:hypothetical protein
MAKKTRKVFHSILTKKDGWIVQADKRMVSMHGTQKESERAAIEAGRKEQERGGSGRLCYTNPTVRSAKSARTARTRKRRPDRSVSGASRLIGRIYSDVFPELPAGVNFCRVPDRVLTSELGPL